MAVLSDFPPQSRVRVVALTNQGGMTRRLMEMGLLPGTAIRIVRMAPLGDPIDLEVRGYHLSLRKSEAKLVQVEEVGEPAKT